jgi:xylan 1,4-beta-xylosidase
MVQNPILPGFNPDPSIVRVGDDYYIATSTFEWYPGVSIHHSKDLVNWTLVAYPLTRLSQLDMRGNPDSCGVWAPCLSYHNGLFYLVFTDVKRFAGDVKDTHNYIVTASDVCGKWSEPTYVNSSGFDPSLFFDDDGRAWFLNMLWDHRPSAGRNNWLPGKYFAGIMLQEYDVQQGKLVGLAKNIFTDSAIGLSEGPHLYKREGWYYLLLAEGGTGKDHACTFARSKRIDGSYEVDPQGPIVTSANDPTNQLKRAGHGDWIETPSGNCYLVHLCSRPLPYRGRSVMGRETAIQAIIWNKQGWPRLASGDNKPLSEFAIETLECSPTRITKQLEDFDTTTLPLEFQTLRMPLSESTHSLTERPGYLRLKGKESLGSLFHQALVARRQQSFCFAAETKVDFKPQSFQQMAGLVCYYNSRKHFYLHITTDEQGRRVLDVLMALNDIHYKYPLDKPIFLSDNNEVKLKAKVEYDLLCFSYQDGTSDWQILPFSLDYSVLCDEVGDGGEDANFTGSFVGMCCQDLSGLSLPADFDYFHYQEKGNTSVT